MNKVNSLLHLFNCGLQDAYWNWISEIELLNDPIQSAFIIIGKYKFCNLDNSSTLREFVNEIFQMKDEIYVLNKIHIIERKNVVYNESFVHRIT